MASIENYRQINKSLNICAFEDYLEGQRASLPPLANVVQVTPRVLRVLGQNAGKFTLQGTNMFIVGTGGSRVAIDTSNGGQAWADLVNREMALRGIRISHVLLTHWHGDHTGGVPDLIRLYPELANSVFKNLPDKGQQPITDGQLFKVEGATIRALHAPGHSEDHMCFILEEENAMFTGDNVLGTGSSAVEDLKVFFGSLQLMHDQQCKVGHPAHGETIYDLPAKIAGEIGQKRRRERQVLQTLRSAGGFPKKKITAKELVDEMYGTDLDKQVRDLALLPFTEEILKKLTEDGKVAFEVRRREKRWYSLDLSGSGSNYSDCKPCSSSLVAQSTGAEILI